MLGERLGHVFDRPLGGVARRIPLSPNSLTIAGFLISAAASVVLMTDLQWGGLLVLLGGMFDVLDGVVARTQHKTSAFGAFLDSVLDRYSDAAMFLGVAVNLLNHQQHTGAMLSVCVIIGAFLISYVRARAEGLGWDCKVGLMERPERLILLVIGSLTGYIMPVLWLLAVLTQFTAAQRIYHVWRLYRAADISQPLKKK